LALLKNRQDERLDSKKVKAPGKTFLLWFVAVILTLSSAVYQRLTGPTHPVRGSVEVDGTEISYELLRSHYTSADAIMKIQLHDAEVEGEIRWRRYKSHDPWFTDKLPQRADTLIITIPKQPSAGKVMYSLSLIDKSGNRYELLREPVIIRFKDPVPIYILIPHIIAMFGSMLLSTRTGLEAIFRNRNTYRLTLWTIGFLFIGGLILGPIVQKFAFGAFWTGWPLGTDLTDTKTAVALLFWLIAMWRLRRRSGGRVRTIIASVVTLIIFLIPHSLLGSEIDYTEIE